jgi:hypothetical protein
VEYLRHSLWDHGGFSFGGAYAYPQWVGQSDGKGYYNLRTIKGTRGTSEKLPRPVSRMDTGELVVDENKVRLMMSWSVPFSHSVTMQLHWLHQLREEEKMTRSETAVLFRTWENTFREFVKVLGSPEKARMRAVGISRDLPTKKYSHQDSRGFEVAIAQDDWMGTGLGGVRFLNRKDAHGRYELTNGETKLRVKGDQEALMSESRPVWLTREQIRSGAACWDLIREGRTEPELARDYEWVPRGTPGEPSFQGGPGTRSPDHRDQETPAQDQVQDHARGLPHFQVSTEAQVTGAGHREGRVPSDCSFHDSEDVGEELPSEKVENGVKVSPTVAGAAPAQEE